MDTEQVKSIIHRHKENVLDNPDWKSRAAAFSFFIRTEYQVGAWDFQGGYQVGVLADILIESSNTGEELIVLDDEEIHDMLGYIYDIIRRNEQ